MTWEYKGHTVTGVGPPYTLTEPSTAPPVAGDLMILFGGHANLAGVYSAPADFTVIDDVTSSAGTDHHDFIAYKIHDGTSGDGYQLGYTGTSAADSFALLCFHNTSASITTDISYVRSTHYVEYGNNINGSAQPITTSVSAALIVLLQVMTGGPPEAVGAPAGYNQAFADSGTITVYMAYTTATAPGVHAPGAYTHTNVSGDNDPANFTLAFAPAAAAGGAEPTLPVLMRNMGC